VGNLNRINAIYPFGRRSDAGWREVDGDRQAEGVSGKEPNGCVHPWLRGLLIISTNERKRRLDIAAEEHIFSWQIKD
jgi:hypothetical protein